MLKDAPRENIVKRGLTREDCDEENAHKFYVC